MNTFHKNKKNELQSRMQKVPAVKPARSRGKKFPLICSAGTRVNITGGWENTETPLSPHCSRIRPGKLVLWDPAAPRSKLLCVSDCSSNETPCEQDTDQVRCDPAGFAFLGWNTKPKFYNTTHVRSFKCILSAFLRGLSPLAPVTSVF